MQSRIRYSLIAACAVFLCSAGVALAAGSGKSKPTPGGHYVGKTAQGRSVNLKVSGNGSEFSGGKIYVRADGTCSGVNPITFAPTPPPAVKINSKGHFSVQGTFNKGNYKATASARGQFTDDGQKLHGTVKLTFINNVIARACTSGPVTFTAKLKS
jgi:hypothetical protein